MGVIGGLKTEGTLLAGRKQGAEIWAACHAQNNSPHIVLRPAQLSNLLQTLGWANTCCNLFDVQTQGLFLGFNMECIPSRNAYARLTREVVFCFVHYFGKWKWIFLTAG